MTPQRRSTSAVRASLARGFSMIELLVSMVIAMTVILAMAAISLRFETGKRQDASTSDLSSSAGYLAYDIDRELRSAGSGFSTMRAETYGCVLHASRSGAQILPALAAFPAPFSSVDVNVRMMPILVYPGAGASGSDVIQVMTGTGGLGETPTQVRLNSVATNTLRLTATVGIRGDDLLLISENGRPCMLEQVDASFTGGATQQVNLAGTYFATSIGAQSLNDRSTGATANAMVFGNATNGNPPRLLLLGLNGSQQLVRYDLLRFTNDTSQNPVPLADGVVDMRVMYGVDNAPANGTVDQWVAPTGAFSPTSLSNGTAAAQTTLARILAVKVSMVVRSELIEKDDIAPATVSMFPSLDATQRVTYTVTAANRKRRHRVLEFTVPIRNVITMSGRPTPP